ncbi:MAG: flagellar motor switch phosphatase FliY [Lachnospiraceae bacterium]|nr:flagellar motor switch phosphatase FliY [Lachnospiraceae bacterium]
MDLFSKEEADVMGEISNICMGSSATSLNVMLNQPVNITTPSVQLVHKDHLLNDYEKSCVIIKVQYTEGLAGNNLFVLKDADAKIITDLMMGGDGKGKYAEGEMTDLHISAVAEAMNQMTASSATAMSKLFDHKIDISPPSVKSVVIEDFEVTDDFTDDMFVKINFKMKIGNLIDSTMVQLYPYDLAHSIYQLFQRRK